MPSSGLGHKWNVRLWRECSNADPVLATYDAAFGLAAQAVGFLVIGL